jgi:hypothetical protein
VAEAVVAEVEAKVEAAVLRTASLIRNINPRARRAGL